MEQPRGLTGYVSSDVERDRIRQAMYRTDLSRRATILPRFRAEWSRSDLEQFATQGYLAMEGVLSLEDVEIAKAAIGDLAHRRTGNEQVVYQEEPYYTTGGGDERVRDPELRVRVIRDFCQAEPRLAELAANPRLARLLDQLLGEHHRLIQDTALLKPPFHGAEKPWHQDSAYFDLVPITDVLGVWIALDEAHVENGCMQIVPGSHLSGPVPHYHVRDCQIEDSKVAVDDAVVVPLKPGGALIFSALLHHGTPPNASGDRRRAVQFHYAAAHCSTMTIAEHAALFDDGGAYAGCRVWELEPGMHRAQIG
jgi:phytanoyl-CoA hydroxylase